MLIIIHTRTLSHAFNLYDGKDEICRCRSRNINLVEDPVISHFPRTPNKNLDVFLKVA